MPMHPLPIVINNGIPVALCSDDPAVFGNLGLTFDFYQVSQIFPVIIVGRLNSGVFQVFVASEVTGLIQLGEMARDSIRVGT